MLLDPGKIRPTRWKRAFVGLVSVTLIGLSCFVVALDTSGESTFVHSAKWVIGVSVAGMALWLLIVAVRGDHQVIDKAIDSIIRGI